MSTPSCRTPRLILAGLILSAAFETLLSGGAAAADAPGAPGMSADLEASVEIRAQGSNRLVTVQVRNHGPDSAADGVSTNRLPAGSTIVGALPPGCIVDPDGVHCSLGTLAPNEIATRSFLVDMKTGGLVVSVAAATPDPAPNNNCGVLPVGRVGRLPAVGRLYCENGSPLANCPVSVEFHDAGGQTSSTNTSTGVDGTFVAVLGCDGSSPAGGTFMITASCCSPGWSIPSESCSGDLGILICTNCPVAAGVIKGNKYHDWNGNAKRDPGEPGLAGWTVQLDPGGVSTVTDGLGNYQFSNLSEGTYTISEVVQPDWTQSFPPPPGTHTVTLRPGDGVIGIDFGNWLKKCVSPPPLLSAWWPLDEPNGATLLAELVGGNNALPQPTLVVGPGGPLAVGGTVAGAKRFNNPPTIYGEVPSSPAVNFGLGDFTIECWINPPTAAQGAIQPIADKALVTCPYVWGYSFYVQDNYLWLILADQLMSLYGSQFTLTPGVWQFVGVTVDRTGNNEVTFYTQGNFDGFPSPIQIFGSIDTFVPLWIGGTRFAPPYGPMMVDELEFFHRVLSEPELDSIYNAGRGGKCKRICGMKFNDLNGNGNKDPNEPGLPNFKILAFGPVNSSAITDANGNYCFSDLPAGTYTLFEAQKLGWTQTAPAGGSYTVTGGASVAPLDFGNRRNIFDVPIDWTPLGTASLSFPPGGGVLVSNLSPSGNDGVAVAFNPPAHVDDFVLLGPFEPAPIGALLRASWFGSYDGMANHLLGSLEIRKSAADSYLFSADFSGVGSPPVSAQLFDSQGNAVGNAAPATSVSASGWPYALRAGKGSIHLNGLFEPGTTIRLNGVSHLAEEARFTSEPAGPVDYISRVELTGSGFETFSLFGASAEPLRPTLSTTRNQGQLVFTWDLPGYKLQSAAQLGHTPSMTAWLDEPGVSPLTLPTSGDKRFFRLKSMAP